MDAIRNLGITKNKVTRIENGRGLRLSVEAGAFALVTLEPSMPTVAAL